MCYAFASAGYKVTLAIEGDRHFDENLDAFIKNSFKEDLRFDVIHWKKIHNNRFINRILVKNRVINIAKKQKPSLIFTREPFFLSDLIKMNIPVIFESHNYKLHHRINLIHKYLKQKIIKNSKSIQQYFL